MKRAIFILFIFIVSCNNKQEMNKSITNNNNVINNGLSKEIIRVIDEMCLVLDSIDNDKTCKVLGMAIRKKDNEYFLDILGSPSYSPWLNYYTLFSDRLIAIYNQTPTSHYDLLNLFDTTKLNKFNGIPYELYYYFLDTTMSYSLKMEKRKKIEELKKNMTIINGFIDEFNGYFEPFGRRYKIHNKDSLELVYTGYF